jgi:hypothetical protein
MGFAVQKVSSYESRITKQIQRQTFVCNKSRENVSNDSALKRRRTNKIIKTKCLVNIIVKDDYGKWVIKSVNLEHNHDLAPTEWLVRFMRCHKNMSESDKTLIEILHESIIPPRKVMTIFRKMRGSYRGVPFDAKYLSN